MIELAYGKPLAPLARTLGVHRRTLYYWLEHYTAQHDPAALDDGKSSGRPSLWTPQLRALLEQSLEHKPDHYGYQASEWMVPLLIEHLVTQSGQRVSDSSMRRQLRRMGYVWKRPRYVLQPDPAREKKACRSPAAGAAPRRTV
jgi:transposase